MYVLFIIGDYVYGVDWRWVFLSYNRMNSINEHNNPRIMLFVKFIEHVMIEKKSTDYKSGM